MGIIDVWEFVKDKEYHGTNWNNGNEKAEKWLFINSYDFDSFVKLFQGVDLHETELELIFRGNYFVVNIETMLDCIDEEITDEIINKLEEQSADN